jgi:hypothetical protein
MAQSPIVLPTPLGDLSTFLTGADVIEASCQIDSATPNQKLPQHLSADGCYLVVWKIKAKTQSPPFTVHCEWADENSERDGDDCHYNSGQYYAAQTWDYNGYELTLGTADGEALAIQAHKGTAIPARFNAVPRTTRPFEPGTDVGEGFDWIEYTRLGLRIHVPSLQAGEQAVLRFGIAWKKLLDPSDPSTWFAAEPTWE